MSILVVIDTIVVKCQYFNIDTNTAHEIDIKLNGNSYDANATFDGTLNRIEKEIQTNHYSIEKIIVICNDDDYAKKEQFAFKTMSKFNFPDDSGVKILCCRVPAYTFFMHSCLLQRQFYSGEVVAVIRVNQEHQLSIALFTKNHDHMVIFETHGYSTVEKCKEFLQKIDKKYSSGIRYLFTADDENVKDDVNRLFKKEDTFPGNVIVNSPYDRIKGGLIIAKAACKGTKHMVANYVPVREMADLKVVPSQLNTFDRQVKLIQPVFKRPKYYFGIDFGTNKTVVAAVNTIDAGKDGTRTMLDDTEYNECPSVAAYTKESTLLVGDKAVQLVNERPTIRALLDIKLYLGKTEIPQNAKNSLYSPFEDCKKFGQFMFKFAEMMPLSPITVTSMIFDNVLRNFIEKLTMIKEQHTNTGHALAVFAYPSIWGEEEKTALQVAAHLSAVTPILIPVYEAAFYAYRYSLQHKLRNVSDNDTIFVVYIGAKFTELAVIKVEDDKVNAVVVDSLDDLGCHSFDEHLYKVYADDRKQKMDKNETEFYYSVRVTAETARKNLGNNDFSTFVCNQDRWNVTKTLYDPVIARFETEMQRTMNKARITTEISKIIVAGGGSAMVLIENVVKKVAKTIDVTVLDNPERSIALGCALYCRTIKH